MTNFKGPYSYHVTTDFHSNGVIEQKLMDIGGEVFRTVIDTRERHVREALIGLGWTPPGGVDSSRHSISELGGLPGPLQYRVLELLAKEEKIGLTTARMSELLNVRIGSVYAATSGIMKMNGRWWVRYDIEDLDKRRWWITERGRAALQLMDDALEKGHKTVPLLEKKDGG